MIANSGVIPTLLVPKLVLRHQFFEVHFNKRTEITFASLLFAPFNVKTHCTRHQHTVRNVNVGEGVHSPRMASRNRITLHAVFDLSRE